MAVVGASTSSGSTNGNGGGYGGGNSGGTGGTYGNAEYSGYGGTQTSGGKNGTIYAPSSYPTVDTAEDGKRKIWDWRKRND